MTKNNQVQTNAMAVTSFLLLLLTSWFWHELGCIGKGDEKKRKGEGGGGEDKDMISWKGARQLGRRARIILLWRVEEKRARERWLIPGRRKNRERGDRGTRATWQAGQGRLGTQGGQDWDDKICGNVEEGGDKRRKEIARQDKTDNATGLA